MLRYLVLITHTTHVLGSIDRSMDCNSASKSQPEYLLQYWKQMTLDALGYVPYYYIICTLNYLAALNFVYTTFIWAPMGIHTAFLYCNPTLHDMRQVSACTFSHTSQLQDKLIALHGHPFLFLFSYSSGPFLPSNSHIFRKDFFRLKMQEALAGPPLMKYYLT